MKTGGLVLDPSLCADCQAYPRDGRSPRCVDCRRTRRASQKDENQKASRAMKRARRARSATELDQAVRDLARAEAQLRRQLDAYEDPKQQTLDALLDACARIREHASSFRTFRARRTARALPPNALSPDGNPRP